MGIVCSPNALEVPCRDRDNVPIRSSPSLCSLAPAPLALSAGKVEAAAGPLVRRPRSPWARRALSTSARRAPAASPQPRRSPASPACTTPAPRQAACGSRPMAARTWKPTFDNETSQAIGALAVSQIESQHRLGRHRRRLGRARHGHDGRRHLQVHRRRRDVDEDGPGRDRPHRHDRHAPDQREHRARLRARPRDRDRRRSAACSRTEDGGKTWQQTLFVDREHGLLGSADVAARTRTS